jgi:hypothetical protein
MQSDVGVDVGAIELHNVLNAFQSSRGHGLYVCESFRDERRGGIDTYWHEVEAEAHGIEDLHRSVGSFTRPLRDEARRDLHRFARTLERLAKRIDRVVTEPGTAMQES